MVFVLSKQSRIAKPKPGTYLAAGENRCPRLQMMPEGLSIPAHDLHLWQADETWPTSADAGFGRCSLPSTQTRANIWSSTMVGATAVQPQSLRPSPLHCILPSAHAASRPILRGSYQSSPGLDVRKVVLVNLMLHLRDDLFTSIRITGRRRRRTSARATPAPTSPIRSRRSGIGNVITRRARP